eukprot:TRINITY_DN2274_c0_g1_i6.p1 TRINITY_DN2274_c0_g1~~TRINITY_DN2274_c0_g1_i6.p1  ORF type:complete len:359 (+),score=55.55 TRINITY_DN2274_c0_g1_i6:119-1195(+)
MDSQHVVQDSARADSASSSATGKLKGQEQIIARQSDAALSQQAEAAVVVAQPAPPVQVVQVAPRNTKVIHQQPRTMSCSPRCIVIVIFLVVVMLLGVYLSITAMAILNEGINKQIDRFSKENERLERINEDYTRNNDELEKNIDDVVILGDQLDGQINMTIDENTRFRFSLDDLEQAESELILELERLKSVQDDLNSTALELQDGISTLVGHNDDLNSTIQQIENQLVLYEEMRARIEDYVGGSDSAALQAVDDYNSMVEKLRDQTARSIMLSLYNVVSSAERHIDGELGFTKGEFDRLVSQSQSILNVSGDFNSSLLQFPGTNNQIVSTTQVMKILQQYIDSTSDRTLAANANATQA